MKAGSWVDCPLDKGHNMIKMKFFKIWNHPFDFCYLCLDAIQQENKTGPYAIGHSIPVNHRPESKPEKDSL